MFDNIETGMNITAFHTISVIGLGYIGLPTAAMFASRKIRVVGVDVNLQVVESINRGEIHFKEPDLDIAVHAAVTEGYLRATTIVEPAQAFLIAVPTPFRGDNHEPDLSFIESACDMIAPVLAKGNLVVLESTSPVGATEQMAERLAKMRPDLSFPRSHGATSDIRIAYCPERVLPGKVMRELISNDRVVGGLTLYCSELAVHLYKSFVQGDCFITNARTAELVKLTENSFRDVNIAFANELSMICETLDINVWELILLANRHPRVKILQPGPGVGGHCIAVDPWFIVSAAPEQSRLIRTAREVNDAKPLWAIDKIDAAVRAHLEESPGKTTSEVTVACYGLAFKPDIDDLRESPALGITRLLSERNGARVLAVEPNIVALPKGLAAVTLCDAEFAAAEADVHVLLVAHRQFRQIAVPMGRLIDLTGAWDG